jgi:phosphopantothenoylcysteine decarboxylase
MANVLLGVTGSVAAIKTPELFALLTKQGHRVRVVATRPALYFFDPNELGSRDSLVLDEDEWPGREEGRRWQRGEPVLHIELRRWADILVIAPLDVNTLAKLAGGLTDNCLTCVWRAWDLSRPVVLAPAMNTLMWDHPATARHLCQVAADAGASPTDNLDPEAAVRWINERCARLCVMMPVSKRLACDDEGMGAMAAVEDIAETVRALLSKPREEKG